MNPTSNSDAPKGLQQPSQLPKTDLPSNEVFGFPIINNQFNVLQTSQSAETQCQEQEAVGLVDPRTTRHLRIAANRAYERGSRADVGRSATVPTHRNTQGTFYSRNVVNPVVSGNYFQFFVRDSFSVSPSEVLIPQSVGHVHYSLGNGAIVDGETLYDDFKCNKRISNAGPEWSAGRPGHTPTRRNLACEKTIEDSCAGQDWSAGRPGNRPFGASSAACPSHITACLGPYGNASRQPHHTGPNTREETYTVTSSTGRPRYEDSTSQHHASSSRRPAAEDRTSPAMVALHPRRPPYFSGGLDEDVYVWTSIVSRWFDTI